MKSVDKAQIIRNVGSSWSALGINVLVGIFLSPYILHRLGDTAFGLWILIFSATGYYGLFDLGIRASVVRFVAKYAATDEQDKLNQLVNTAVFCYGGIGLVTMAITLIAGHYVGAIFRIQAEVEAQARWLFLIVGASVSLSFPLGMFGGILEGLQRFYFVNFTGILSTLSRALLIVVALRHGYGLLAVAVITVSLPLVAAVINAVAVFRIVHLEIGWRLVNWASLRSIAGYSGTTFVIIVAHRLRFKTDAVVIGAFVSAAAITYFTIGSRLVEYASEVVSSLAQIFVPMSSQSQASGDLQGVRKIVLLGNRACAFITFPITIVLTILGKSFIEVWVGPKYIATSYPVLLILLYPTALLMVQSGSGRTLWGLAKHGTWAWVVLAEGISNVLLSVILVRPYGIIGDAIGTAVPMACSMILFLPMHICRLLRIKMTTYLQSIFVLPLALCVPLTVALLLMQRWFTPHRLGPLAVQLAIAGVIYGLGLGWAFWTHRAWDVGRVGANPEDELTFAMVEGYQEET